MQPKVLCVIPARMGSVRVPYKNIKEIKKDCTLIDQAVQCCGDLDFVITTDQPDLLDNYAKKNIINRPAEISGSTSDISEAIKHALEQVDPESSRYDIVVTLQPAVVARSQSMVQHMLSMFMENNVNGAVTVVKTHPWIWKVRSNKAINDWHPNPYPRSQDADSHFVEINSIQITTADNVRKLMRWDLPLMLYELPEWSTTLDIDTQFDFEEAKEIYSWGESILAEWRGNCFIIKEVNGIVSGSSVD